MTQPDVRAPLQPAPGADAQAIADGLWGIAAAIHAQGQPQRPERAQEAPESALATNPHIERVEPTQESLEAFWGGAPFTVGKQVFKELFGEEPPEHLARDGDPVHDVKHYQDASLGECIDFTITMDFVWGSAFKYVWRFDWKGKPLEDLSKALQYVLYAIERDIPPPSNEDLAETILGVDDWGDDHVESARLTALWSILDPDTHPREVKWHLDDLINAVRRRDGINDESI